MEYFIAYFIFNGLLLLAHYADSDKITVKQGLVLALFGSVMILIGAITKLRDRRRATGQ